MPSCRGNYPLRKRRISQPALRSIGWRTHHITQLPGQSPKLDDPALRVLAERPAECAYWTLTRSQKFTATLGLGLLVAALLWRPLGTLIVINGVLIAFYLVHAAYKFYLVWLSLDRAAAVEVTQEQLAALRDTDLPSYTVLVPMYREAGVLAQLVDALKRLDYPPDKLEILLLLEPDDPDTQTACQQLALPPQFRLITVPDSIPKTKPKACGIGLAASRSDFLVIYDAEDRPEPDQLKKAVVVFAQSLDNVACVQAKLNYYNQRQNLLTRWFTAEYSVWFDLFLPGLTASGAPIPLGGTSNHFRTAILKQLGGWDPFNVTEDCDLGVRLHKHGYRTLMMDSTTWEEANSHLFSWLRQRSRWVKGYLQTYLVHMRHPLRLLRQLGLANFFSFQMTIGGSVLCYLVNPLYWALTVLWFASHPPVLSALFPCFIYPLGVFCLYVGNFVFVYLAVAGCMNRQYYDLVKYAVLSPVYWLLMSIGAYKGVIQMLPRPHYWEKTDHGFVPPEVRL